MELTGNSKVCFLASQRAIRSLRINYKNLEFIVTGNGHTSTAQMEAPLISISSISGFNDKFFNRSVSSGE